MAEQNLWYPPQDGEVALPAYACATDYENETQQAAATAWAPPRMEMSESFAGQHKANLFSRRIQTIAFCGSAVVLIAIFIIATAALILGIVSYKLGTENNEMVQQSLFFGCYSDTAACEVLPARTNLYRFLCITNRRQLNVTVSLIGNEHAFFYSAAPPPPSPRLSSEFLYCRDELPV